MKIKTITLITSLGLAVVLSATSAYAANGLHHHASVPGSGKHYAYAHKHGKFGRHHKQGGGSYHKHIKRPSKTS